mgnify:CR=1 FL=1
MQYLDRLFIVLLALTVAVISLGLIGFSLGLVEGLNVIEYLAQQPIIVGIIGLVAFLVSLRVLQLSITRKKKVKQTVIADGELGNIKMSLGAVKKLVKAIVEQEAEVTDIDSKVKVKEEGVNIFLKLDIASPGNISDLAKRLQQEVQDQVTKTTWAKVN